MLKRSSILVVCTLLVSSCATYNIDQELAITCRSFTSTVQVMIPFVTQMSTKQIDTMNDAISVLAPSCRAAAEGKAPVLETMRNALRALLIVEMEVKP